MTEDLDELYRRASARDPSRPNEVVRRKILEHAAALAAPTRKPAGRARWRPAIFGTLAAAALAGLMVIPRFFNPHPAVESSGSAAPGEAAPTAHAPSTAAAPPTADARLNAAAPPSAAPSADALPLNEVPVPPPTSPRQAAAKSRANAPAPAPAPADEPTAGTQLNLRGLAQAGPGARAPRKSAPPIDETVQSGAAAENRTSFGPSSPVPDRSAALRRAAETGDVASLRAILDTPVRIDAPDGRGQTALMLAVSRGQLASVDVLLAHGADPNAANADGTTPLQAALAAEQPAIAAALRRAGAR